MMDPVDEVERLKGLSEKDGSSVDRSHCSE